MNDTLPVSAIKNGTVIDHITPGQALRIIHLLNLNMQNHKVTIGMHLPSVSMGSKDLIKIETRILTDEEANEIVVFAPLATINIIESFQVIKKFNTRLPSSMRKVFVCPNKHCITHIEPIDSHFTISEQGKKIKLTCCYCEKIFDRDHLKVSF